MFIHNFKYTFKVLIRNKSLVFWTFAFPIILATLFNMAFSNISESEKLSISNIAIVNSEEFKNNNIYVETFKELSEDNKNKLFNIDYVNESSAKKLLESDKIDGYLIFDNNKPLVYIKNNGIHQTILKYVIDEIESVFTITNNIIEYEIQNGNNIDVNTIYQNVYNKLNSDNINVIDKSSKNMNYVMIEFYTLIAMTCLYGGIIAMTSINNNLANMSNNGKRIEVSPTKKRVIVFSSLVSSYFIQLIGLLLLFVYTIFILNVDYGNNISQIILLSMAGSLTGLSLGLCVGVVFKKSDSVKVGILLAISMIGSFLSGMMGVTLKYIIDKNVPIINRLNPASIITDGFYSIYYYNSLDRYFYNIISLLVLSFLFTFISIMSLRRKQYDSI